MVTQDSEKKKSEVATPYGLSLEILEYHFYYILLIKASHKANSDLWGEDRDSPP